MKNSCLRDAPRDRRILVYNKIWSYINYRWKHTGNRWEEAWYNPKPTMRPDNWALWCGSIHAHTTNRVDADAWAEIPLEINT